MTVHTNQGTDREPQLVGWDSQQNTLYKTISLADVTPSGSFINDLRIDEALLNQHHTFGDPALLRRELFERGLVDRVRDGSAYWLKDR